MANLLQNFENILHEPFLTEWKLLESKTIHNDGNVIVCFAGGQGLGKSSLINMLLDENLLPVGDNSDAILPVHIAYGSSLSAQIVRTAGKREPISLDGLRKPAEYTVRDIDLIELTVHQEWLRGLTIVDLSVQGEILLRYQTMSDAIVYLVSGDGPSEEYLAAIKGMALAGKRVYIGFNKWDIFADEKTTTGQPLPDIQTWENLIEVEVGIKIPVVPTSSKGTGKFALTLFLESLVENKAIIRQERFQNAAINILKDAFSDLFHQTVETQKLERKLIEIQTDKAEMVNRLENLKNQLSVKAEQDKQSSQQNAVLQAEKQKLKTDNEEMVNRLENLKNQLTVKAEQDKQLNQKNADLIVEKQKLKTDNEEMVNRLENLKNQLSVKAEQDKQLNKKNAELQVEKQKLKADNAEMVNELENLKNQLTVKAEQDKQLNKKNAELQTESQNLKADIVRLNKDFEQQRTKNYQLANTLAIEMNKGVFSKIFFKR
jgi:hypothetical protein